MANWVSTTGQIKKLTKKERKWIEENQLASADNDEWVSGHLVGNSFVFTDPPEYDEQQLWKRFLREFRPNGHFGISWAFESSGEHFGGGAQFYTAKSVKHCNTARWLEAQEKTFIRHQKAQKTRALKKAK